VDEEEEDEEYYYYDDESSLSLVKFISRRDGEGEEKRGMETRRCSSNFALVSASSGLHTVSSLRSAALLAGSRYWERPRGRFIRRERG